MMKEDATILVGRQRKRENLNGLFVLWLLILVLALVGAIVAASSNAPVIWMLAWPAPLIVIFTAARFIGEGFHKRDGVLVFGRPMTTRSNVPLAGASVWNVPRFGNGSRGSDVANISKKRA